MEWCNKFRCVKIVRAQKQKYFHRMDNSRMSTRYNTSCNYSTSTFTSMSIWYEVLLPYTYVLCRLRYYITRRRLAVRARNTSTERHGAFKLSTSPGNCHCVSFLVAIDAGEIVINCGGGIDKRRHVLACYSHSLRG